MQMNRLLILIVLVSVAACSNKAVYENMRTEQRNECMQEQSPRYEECMERTNESYEEFQREREEMLEKE